MIDKLDLPFPLLSDPDRSSAIVPFDVADAADKRNIARPAVILLDPSGTEVYRRVARDFADRVTEDDVVEQVRALGLPPTSQAVPELGTAEPGPKAMPFDALVPYYRGARFAVVAMSRRHPEIESDAQDYIDEMDRYMANVVALFRKRRERAQESG